MLQELKQKFKEYYGDGQVECIFSPGRVNLIGEHTDYNGGHVFPCALTIGTYMLARKREDRTLRFFSVNFEKAGVFVTSLDELTWKKEDRWTNYPKGVIWAFQQKGFEINYGMDVLVYGNIPNGSGLSSSASLEVATGLMLKTMFGFDQVTMTDIALWGQYAENRYNGVNCGIMDQFACAMGKEGHAIFLDTADLSYQYVPVQLTDAKVLIACSNKKRGLGDSKYNERRSECEEALKDIQKVMPIKNLGELTEETFEQVKGAIRRPICVQRARHAVLENQRTLQAVEALNKNEIELFGRLMNESHVSLRDDYELTGVELDTLVEEAWKCEGVIGSRMTGAGFGGCTVSIVKNDAVDNFIASVGKAYEEKIGYPADFYVVDIGAGAYRIEE